VEKSLLLMAKVSIEKVAKDKQGGKESKEDV